MRRIAVGQELEGFRTAARLLIAQGIAPSEVVFESETEQLTLLTSKAEVISADATRDEAAPTPRVPKAFLALAQTVSVHRSPERWGLLYEVLYRLSQGEAGLLEDPTCAPVLALQRMRQSVERDVHKTHAFVRFRKVMEGGEEHFIAWHEPQHRSLPLSAPHFVRRFGSMRWSILTPDASVSWDLEALRWSAGVSRQQAPSEDVLEDLWRSYYASIFNPARLNLRAMQAEMPRRHWKTLPEAELITQLSREAPARTRQMTKKADPSPASELVPPDASLPSLREAARGCLLCPWAQASTQAVWGEGPAKAAIMLVGEQPGDMEDVQGRPFVGPAGQLLDRALQTVGLPRDQLYITNAVKHFKYEQVGKRRIHEKPNARDVHTCRGWLEAEIRAVSPQIIVALGATAGQAFLGPSFRLTRSRGQFLETPWTSQWLATYHPSALLRAPTEEARLQMTHQFEEDLRTVAAAWRGSQTA